MKEKHKNYNEKTKQHDSYEDFLNTLSPEDREVVILFNQSPENYQNAILEVLHYLNENDLEKQKAAEAVRTIFIKHNIDQDIIDQIDEVYGLKTV